jgi:hypothetical protein
VTGREQRYLRRLIVLTGGIGLVHKSVGRAVGKHAPLFHPTEEESTGIVIQKIYVAAFDAPR